MCRYRQPGIVAVLTQNSAETPAEEQAAIKDHAQEVIAEVAERIGALVRCADPLRAGP